MKHEVELHSMEESGVAATRATLKMIGGELTVEDGKAYVEGPDFVFWAAERQGYVRRVRTP